MTVRTIGRKEKATRLSLAALAASLMLGGVPPSLAQTDQPAPAPSPAPTPAPSSTFRLPPEDDGRTSGVQGPADNGLPPLAPGERRGSLPSPTATPTPTPAPAPRTAAPVVVPTRPSGPAPTPAATPRDTSGTGTPAPRSTPTPAPAAPLAASPADPATTAAPGSAPAIEAPSPATPGFSVDPTAPVGSDGEDAAAPVQGEGGTPLWAWLLAGLAAAGAGVWYWRRRLALAGDATAELAEVSPPADPRPAPRAVPPQSAPVPPRPAPSPQRSAPQPAASPLVTRPAAERRAQVAMALDIRGIRMTADQLIVAFTLRLRNEGPVAATGLMVRIALNQGSAMTEPVLARFFDGAGGSVLRDDMEIAAGAGEQLATEVMLPRAAVDPLIIGGRPMLIPVLVFDVTYHWDGEGDAFGQNAGSFVLGREQGASGSEKLAPLPLDHPNLVVNRPGARITAIRRSQ